MKKPVTIFSLCIVIFLNALPAQNSHELTLSQALEIALKQNEDVLKAKNNLASANSQIREARADALPNITFSGSYTRNLDLPVFFFPSFTNPGEQQAIRVGSDNSYSAIVSVAQPLFRAGKIGRALKVAKLFKQYSSEGYKGVRGDVIVNVHDGYYQVLLAQKVVEVNRQTSDLTRQHLDYSRTLFQQGQVSEYDTLRQFVEFVNTQPVLLNSQNTLQVSLNNLKNIIGIDQSDELTLLDTLAYKPQQIPDLAAAMAKAEENRPELKMVSLEASMRQQNIGIVRAAILPSVDLIGSWRAQAESDKWDFGKAGFVKSTSAGVQLTIPIFDGFRTYAQVDKARAEYQNALYDESKVRDQVQVEIKSLINNAKEAEKSLWAQRSNLNQAQRALELAQLRYREGQAKTLDLEDAVLALNQAKSNYYRILTSYLMVKIRLDRAMGVL